MRTYSLKHLADSTLLGNLTTLVARDRSITAAMLAHLAEVDTRKLHVDAGYPSLFAYCVGVLRFSEEAAYKRIHAARASRRFPAIFEAVADGRLHLSAIVLLAPHLTRETCDELIAAAAHKTKAEVERLLAARYPRPDMPELVRALPPRNGPSATPQSPTPNGVERLAAAAPNEAVTTSLSNEPTASAATELNFQSAQHAPGRVETMSGSRVEPLAHDRYGVQLTIDQSTHDKLRYAQDLLGHQVVSQDLAGILDRALDALIRVLEKRKFAATDRPSHPRPASASSRYVPAHVKREVWRRDGKRCTFVSDTGHRCEARTGLELDHVDPVARGGRATVARMRLRCRAHNQLEAERAFGRDFMSRRREQARAADARRVGPTTAPPSLAIREAALGAGSLPLAGPA